MKCEICGIREAVTSYVEERNCQKIFVHICEECFRKKGNIEEVKCDVCNMSYREFLATGVFGCENCYRVFKVQTIKLLENKILVDKYRSNNKKASAVKIENKSRKKEFLKELEEVLELAKKENDKEKIEKIEKEIKKIKEMEFEKN